METADDDWLLHAEPHDLRWFTRGLNQRQKDEYDYTFATTAHDGQLPPPGDWRTWLILAGRGFGKTRAGAEWVRSVADADPDARIALVAATLQEARSVMVEGESGLLACCPPPSRPHFEPSLRRVTFANGAVAQLFGANEPEALRGPQHSHAARAKRPIRPRHPPKAKAGSWLLTQPAAGPGRTASLHPTRAATGCSLRRTTA
jgi:phage terminase large subunit-like protein